MEKINSHSHLLLAKNRPLLYLLVGLTNTVLDFMLYTLLTQTIFNDPSDIAFAGILSGTVALIVAFVTHSQVTWRGAHMSLSTILRFIVFTGIGMWVIRPILLSIFINLDIIFEPIFSMSQVAHLPFNKIFITNTGAFCCMLLIVLIYNYFVYDRFVFQKNGRKQPTV